MGQLFKVGRIMKRKILPRAGNRIFAFIITFFLAISMKKLILSRLIQPIDISFSFGIIVESMTTHSNTNCAHDR